MYPYIYSLQTQENSKKPKLETLKLYLLPKTFPNKKLYFLKTKATKIKPF